MFSGSDHRLLILLMGRQTINRADRRDARKTRTLRLRPIASLTIESRRRVAAHRDTLARRRLSADNPDCRSAIRRDVLHEGMSRHARFMGGSTDPGRNAD